MNDGTPPTPPPVADRELADAREKLRFQSQILDSVGQAIIATDVFGFITYVNPGAERLFRWTSAEVVGRKIGEVTKTGVSREQAVDIIARLSRGETWTGEFLFTRKDGTQFVGEVINWPIRSAEGKLIGVSGIAQDLTERRALETQLRQAQKLEVIGRLAGGIAHDFNNILQTMLLNIQMLQLSEGRDPEDQESLQEVKALTERAATVTSQLLMFARRQAAQLQTIELTGRLAQTVALLRRLLGEQINITVENHPAPLWINVDSGMLDQVIMNLCLNARDAMPNGGELALRSSAVTVEEEQALQHSDARPGQYTCLSVRDTGSGMSADLLEHIFEPFFTTKELGKGTGLGLAAVYGIIRQHGGFVRVESALGTGTTFSVFLPMSQPAVVHTVPHQAGPAPSAGPEHTLLVVEDEDMLRDSIAALLQHQGYRVLTAPDGPAALELWKKHGAKIELVISDVRMPGGISGLGLSQRLRKDQPELRIILMSGYSTEIIDHEANPLEDIPFLEKPFSYDILLDTVRHCLA